MSCLSQIEMSCFRIVPREKGREMDTIQMSPKEIIRLEAMQRVKEKRMSQVEAARQLRLSERQVQRL
ncbi:MAG: helix-turn-helix domain-containing protein, partial [Anaerolineales bacterium]